MMRSFDAIPPDLRLQAQDVPPTYDERMYFILGPGFGDTINDFRILHEVLAQFPRIKSVVYADPRWKEIYPCIPELQNSQLRYSHPAPSAAAQQREKEVPHHHTFRRLLQEVFEECKEHPGFVAIGGFKLADQLSRKEPSIAMKARAIGLTMKQDGYRPYFPLSPDALAGAQQFLHAQKLTPGRYFAVAPYTWPDKMWEHRSWETLVNRLHEATRLPILVIGVHGYPPIQAPSIREAIGLPLPQVAALIAQARCYIGLDSGPTHLAACFDIPVVALNPQGKFPPFLVEPHTPYKRIHITPGIYGSKPISVASVFEVVCKALEQPMPPDCPVCAAQPYILGAKDGKILYLCRCGLIFRTGGQNTKPEKDRNERRIPFDQDPKTPTALPTAVDELDDFSFRILRTERRLDTAKFSFEHWDSLEADPLTLLNDSTRDVWWNWDSAYAFLSKSGWRIADSNLKLTGATGNPSFSVEINASPGESGDTGGQLRMPWGRKIFKVNRTTYERWLAWGTFRNQGELEGLGWNLVNEGKKEEGHFILKMAFQVQPRWRGLKRLILTSLGSR